MTKFITRVVMVEAVQIVGASSDPNQAFSERPTWLNDALNAGMIASNASVNWLVQSPSGPVTAIPGNWIVRGGPMPVLSVSTADAFNSSYEPV